MRILICIILFSLFSLQTLQAQFLIFDTEEFPSQRDFQKVKWSYGSAVFIADSLGQADMDGQYEKWQGFLKDWGAYLKKKGHVWPDDFQLMLILYFDKNGYLDAGEFFGLKKLADSTFYSFREHSADYFENNRLEFFNEDSHPFKQCGPVRFVKEEPSSTLEPVSE